MNESIAYKSNQVADSIIFTQSRLDVHKHSIYATELNEDGNIKEQYEFANSEECWDEFKNRYIRQKPEIALEVTTSGKYVTGLLRDMGFSVHMADPSKLPVIYKSTKKYHKY